MRILERVRDRAGQIPVNIVVAIIAARAHISGRIRRQENACASGRALVCKAGEGNSWVWEPELRSAMSGLPVTPNASA